MATDIGIPKDLIIVNRDGWGAKPAKPIKALRHPIHFVRLTEIKDFKPCLNHLECEQVIRNLQDKDMSEHGLPDITPNFLVGDDGRVYEGRGWFTRTEKNAVFKKWDGKILQITYLGPFRKDGDPPKKFLIKARDLLKYGIAHGYFAKDLEVLDQYEKTE